MTVGASPSMLKKPSILFSSYSNIHCLYSHNSNLSPTSTSHAPPSSNRAFQQKNTQRKYYATVHSGRPNRDDGEHPPWPELPNSRKTPTPYQIFNLKKDAPYSKYRFYELAKIYHPDRNGHGKGHSGINHLPGSIKIERYRLIVTAHEILSDPVKRRAYDTSGAGWNYLPEHGVPRQQWNPNKGNRWTESDKGSPFNNATWEDWERWYQGGKGKQEPVYFSNGGFIILVIAAIFFGGFGQSSRLEGHANTFKRQVERAHDDASRAVRKHKADTKNLRNQEQRLQNFLATRDLHGYGILDPREASYRKLLPKSEACMSEGIQQQGHDHNQEAA